MLRLVHIISVCWRHTERPGKYSGFINRSERPVSLLAFDDVACLIANLRERTLLGSWKGGGHGLPYVRRCRCPL